jgi:hypothetical protein
MLRDVHLAQTDIINHTKEKVTAKSVHQARLAKMYHEHLNLAQWVRSIHLVNNGHAADVHLALLLKVLVIRYVHTAIPGIIVQMQSRNQSRVQSVHIVVPDNPDARDV